MRLQSAFMQTAQTERPPLAIYLTGGVRITGIIAGEDGYTLLVVDRGRAMLVYKHAIAAILPARPMDLRAAAGEPAPTFGGPAPSGP
ncbi:MAG TPA: RNA chaperone Hfq [Stellaceae bacterium]|nr:RNA chaperone Hfq [Stellaceae bacterium]